MVKDSGVGKGSDRRKLSPLNAWAFSFACAIGWAAYVMPATTFLPMGGIAGSLVAFLTGGLAMCVIAWNYHYLGNLIPDQGGIYHLVKQSMNRELAFVAGWGMGLAHLCCIPLNAKAMAMLIRVFLETVFGVDFEVFFFGSDTLLIEAILIVAGLILFGFINVRGIKSTARVQTVGAITLLGGIVIMLVAALVASPDPFRAFGEMHAPGISFPSSFMSIFLITPWAFVGFDSLSKVTQDLNFPLKKIGKVMIISVLCGTFAYVANILITLFGMPDEFASWPEYLASLKNLPGIDGYPVAIASKNAMGITGTVIFFVSCISATLTGLIGFFASVSRLIEQMAQDNVLPATLGKVDEKRNTPVHAIWLVVVIALGLSLLRNSFDFIEEVASIGTDVGFGLISIATFVNSRKRHEKKFMVSGAVGTVLCLFWLVFMFIHTDGTTGAMSVTSAWLLLVWVFIGIGVFSFYTRSKEKGDIEVALKEIEMMSGRGESDAEKGI